MQQLLPHYERELAFLRTHAADFARQNPKIAGHLLMGNEAGEDPHVERLIESFALLTARAQKRLDDDFPLFTESLLQVLYPHYLRPLPSCSIACFTAGGTTESQETIRLPRGSLLASRPVRGVTCSFRTTSELVCAPLRVASVAFRSVIGAPEGTSVPRAATAALSLRLELVSSRVGWAGLGLRTLRVFLDGEASQVSALREALCGHVLTTFWQPGATGRWTEAPDAAPREAGFAEDEALIDFDARSHPAYRLLTEYFGFPEKFDFIDLPLPEDALQSDSRTLTLHYALSGLRHESPQARLLETVAAKNLVLGCAPVVNHFALHADPIRLTHESASYPVLPDGRQAFGFEVYSIDKVYRVQQTAAGEKIAEFKPFYSLQHDELLTQGDAAGRYWAAHFDELLAEQSPGYETELSIIDLDFDPAESQSETLSIDVSATNRDLPSELSIGEPGGDLFVVGGGGSGEIRLLRKPTANVRFERGRGALWRLVSHLSVNHLSLCQGGIDALKEMLRLYDLPRSASNSRQVAGLLAVEYVPASACLQGNPFATFVRGMEIRISVDEQSFAGSGLRLFAQVLDRFFGLYVHANSFTRLVLLSARTREELIACPRRAGDSPLL